MPFYSYVCEACGHGFETLVRGDEVPACPACGSGNLTRQVANVAPVGKLKEGLKRVRAQAAKEGHFSNYSKSELKGKL
ncbi:MAG: zinc ribbon domain-containing protein [Pseudomonadota bacterium]